MCGIPDRSLPCTESKYEHKDTHIKIRMSTSLPQYAGAFFFDPRTNSVLLHQRDHNTKINPGKWAFFGGLCENSETPRQGLVREIKEELDVVVPPVDAIELTVYINEKLGTMRNIFYFEVDASRLAPVLHEGNALEWISLDRVFSYDLTDNTKADLKLFISRHV